MKAMTGRPGSASAGSAGTPPAALEFGRTLRSLRRARGLAQRDLLKPLHLASHSGIAEYEACKRIPSQDLTAAYERIFGLQPGSLVRLRARALAERAAAEAAA